MLPFVGPSYTLATRQASSQRAVNLYLQAMETPSKAGVIMRAVPGLALFASLGAEIRGAIEAAGRCFFVAGGSLYELASDGTATSRGSLLTTTGNVGMAWGTTQLVIVDGANGYVFTLSSNVFAQITDTDFPGSDRVDYLDGFFLLKAPGTQQFYVTAIDDASNIDALDFASAESTPDDIVAHVTVNQRVYLLGELVTEVWFNSGNEDFPLSRSSGETIDVGCIAAWSVVKADAGLLWIGRDLNGSGIVYKASGGPPSRISTVAVEEALQASTNLAGAVAYVYQDHGQTFYAINAPGVASTWVYEVATNAWHERCDLDGDGQFIAHRATHHVFALGLHLVGDADGKVYRMDRTLNTFDGDARVCERTSPNDAAPLRDLKSHSAFVLDCLTGEAASGAPMAELSWSNDGGATFGNPVERSAGALGNRYQRLVWRRLGRSRDRVWRVRFSADAPFAIVSGEAA
jgi:hypothetical protein